ncbi:11337_t:CDS:2 [Diversispora eburnea]|uniref:11337_t:CDS:1 n=1 Tax=Diversispora eburnea TaxID=1213867 RepID=A0A9N9B8L9_9GLOM|nr:11337_t:CDS:2 [Diversispora eburnea]
MNRRGGRRGNNNYRGRLSRSYSDRGGLNFMENNNESNYLSPPSPIANVPNTISSIGSDNNGNFHKRSFCQHLSNISNQLFTMRRRPEKKFRSSTNIPSLDVSSITTSQSKNVYNSLIGALELRRLCDEHYTNNEQKERNQSHESEGNNKYLEHTTHDRIIKKCESIEYNVTNEYLTKNDVSDKNIIQKTQSNLINSINSINSIDSPRSKSFETFVQNSIDDNFSQKEVDQQNSIDELVTLKSLSTTISPPASSIQDSTDYSVKVEVSSPLIASSDFTEFVKD